MGQTDPTGSTWVGLNPYDGLSWVGLDFFLTHHDGIGWVEKTSQLNLCTPLTKGISVFIKFLRVFIDILYI